MKENIFMKICLSDIIKDAEQSIQDKILAFDILCHDLQILVDRENDILLAGGVMVFDSGFVKKIHLMNIFEHDISDVLSVVKDSLPYNIPLHSHLIESIQNIRRSLCINTTFHMDDLKKRTERMSSLKEGITLYADSEPSREDTVCH